MDCMEEIGQKSSAAPRGRVFKPYKVHHGLLRAEGEI